MLKSFCKDLITVCCTDNAGTRAMWATYHVARSGIMFTGAFFIKSYSWNSDEINLSYLLCGLGIVDIANALLTALSREKEKHKQVIDVLNKLCTLLQSESLKIKNKVINRLNEIFLDPSDEDRVNDQPLENSREDEIEDDLVPNEINYAYVEAMFNCNLEVIII